MFHDRQELTALISSRICHDLVSPLGAISNGLELLTMTGQPDGPEMDLIGQSVDSANSKIRFFRIAYGNAPNGSTLAQGEILSVIRDYFKDNRITAAWHPAREVQRRDVKLIFLAIQCLENALPYGGQIDINFDNGEWVLGASNPKLRALPDLWGLLEGQEMAEPLTSEHVQFGLLAMLTQWRKPALSVTVGDAAIVIRL